MHVRPSRKEIDKKIERASCLIGQDKWAPSNIQSFNDDCEELGRCTAHGRIRMLKELMSEVNHNFYKGRRPPEISSSTNTNGLELFAFSWFSNYLKKRVYIKFALDDNWVWVVSLHKDRPRI